MSENLSLGEKMQKIDRRWLYAILLVLTSGGLFMSVEVPVIPDKTTLDLYVALSNVPTDKTVLVQSDWTQSTRGENAGHFEAVMRFLMSRDIKFAIYSFGDPQSPQVARNSLLSILEERKEQGLKEYKEWEDYVVVGYFPNAEAQTVSLQTDIRKAWSTKKIRDPISGTDRSPFESPVLENIHSINDAGFLIIVTASNTIEIAVERLSADPILIGGMCTGVVGPQILPFHQSGQVVGVAVGQKGVYDFEYMMKYGVNVKTEGAIGFVKHSDPGVVIQPITEGTTFGRGKSYYATLHIALILMILTIIVGNVGLALSSKRSKS